MKTVEVKKDGQVKKISESALSSYIAAGWTKVIRQERKPEEQIVKRYGVNG